MKRLQVANGAMYALSITIIAASLLFGYISIAPFQVLKNWTIVVDGKIHRPGDVLAVQSIYTKLRSVSGIASRYIECRNANGSYTRYPVNEADANHAPGSTATGAFIKIPESIPSLPTKCHVSISIDYRVYSFRTVTEAKSSSDFTLLPPSTP